MSLRLVISLAIALVLLAGAHSFAQSTNSSANTLRVSPVRTDIEIQPGESKTVDTSVTNLTDAPITVRPIQNDFIAGDERGTPALILDEDEFAPTHSLKRFMGPLEDVTIPAGESRRVAVTISVPEDAQAGGYYGAVRFAPASPNEGGQVDLNASVASLILLTVPGDLVEQLDLTDFEVQQNGAPGGLFGSSDNLTASFRFENKGNVQVGPIGKISVTQGDTVVYEADFNNKNPRDVVLPDSARRWDVALHDLGSFGHYTVNATLTYGTTNKSIEVTKSFWIIPLSLILAVVAGIALIVGIWLFLRSYKKRILRKNSFGRRY